MTVTDTLRGELERLFDLPDMLRLSSELLGYAPEDVGGTSGKGAFARALVDKCREEDALLALSDAIVVAKQGKERGIDVFVLGGEEFAVGSAVAGWTIQKKLGEGGIATTYMAERNGERVALKVLRSAFAKDRAGAKRWLTTARSVSQLQSPSLGVIVELGELPDQRPFVATQFLDGQSLGARIGRTGAMHFNEARPILRGLLSALEALHARGIAHGGVKSENVFIVRSSAESKMKNEPTGVLIDAGTDRLFARPPLTSSDRSGILAIAGTPKTFAPEQAREGRATVSSDLYAAACTLYEAITGKPVFSGASAIDVIAAHILSEPAPPSSLAPRGWVSHELDEVLEKALAKRPEDRFASAKQFREALEVLGRASVPPEARKREELDQSAFDRISSALLADPANEEHASELEQLVDAAQEWARAIATFAAAAENAEALEVKKSLLFRSARLAETDLSDNSGAEATYRKVLELDPEDEVARVALEELKRQTNDFEGLAELLLEKVEREEVASERAQTLRELAELYGQLDDAENSFVAWVQALTDEPRDERSAREIERLAGQDQARWNEALASLSEAVQASEDRDAKIALYVLMGRWYESKLARPDFALPCYGQALALDPSNESALEGTSALYRKAQSWQELAQILARRAEVATSKVKGRDFLVEAAEIIQTKLGDSANAAAMYETVLEADPAHPKASAALEELYTEKKDWSSLAKLLEARAENLRGEHRADALTAWGEVLETRLNDRERTLGAYDRALQADPRHLGALKGKERLLSAAQRWADLLDVLEAELELVPTPRQRISLLERIGALQEEEFVEHAKAADVFERIIAIEPGHEGANTALARLYRHLHRWDDLASTLERHAKSASDESRRIGLLLQASRTLAVDLGSPERAIALSERVLALDPKNGEALELVARLRAQGGDTHAALEALLRMIEAEQDRARKADLLVRAGKMLEESGDKDAAIRRYKEALDLHQDNLAASVALRSLYDARGDVHGAAELLLREIAATPGPSGQAKLYAELGELRRERLHDIPSAREAFQKALALDGTCTPAARGLGRLAFETRDWASAAKHLEPLLARTVEMTNEVARDVSLQAGDAFRHLSQFDKAQRAYLNAKAFAPQDREVLERLAAVTFEAGASDEAAEMYRDIIAHFGAELAHAEKGEVLYRFGEALRRSEQLEEAENALEEAAQLLPGARAPLDALKELYTTKQDWNRVLDTLKRNLDSSSDDRRFEVLVEMGDVQLQKLADKQRASKSYVAALELREGDRNLLGKLMAVYSETKDWGKLVEVILRIADLVEEPLQLAKYYNTAAAITQHELKKYDEAADYYEQALAHEPTFGKAFEGLVNVLTERANFRRLETVYRNRIKKLEATDGDPIEIARLWDALGELLKHRLSRPVDAVEAFDQAQKLDPDNRSRAEQLAEIYAEEPKRWFSKAVAVHQQLLTLSPYRIESYQALRKLYTESKNPDASFMLCQALTALKNAEPDEEAFFKKHRAKRPVQTKESISEESWNKLLLHPDQDPLLTEIFTTIAPAVIRVRAQPLDAFGIDANKKLDPSSDESMVKVLNTASAVTRITLPELYLREADPGGLSFVFANPPALGLGKAARSGGHSQALAFIAGRQLAYARGGMYLRHLVPTGSGLRGWLLSAIKSVVPQFPIPADLQTAVDEHLVALKSLPGPQQDLLRSLVQKLLSAAPELDLKKWTAAVDLTADRVGFLVANDLEVASAVIKVSPEEASSVPQKDRLRELHLFSVSPGYLSLRQKLGIAIGD